LLTSIERRASWIDVNWLFAPTGRFPSLALTAHVNTAMFAPRTGTSQSAQSQGTTSWTSAALPPNGGPDAARRDRPSDL